MKRNVARILVAAAILGASAGTLSAFGGRTAPRRVEMVIEAHMGHFTPRVLRVQRGDTVHVTLKAMDTAHGFKIQGREVDITAMPGMPAEVSFVVDWDGGVEWYCTFSCGPQHGSMSGMIVAERRSGD
jgi:cytochrome c oxidase subunit 2